MQTLTEGSTTFVTESNEHVSKDMPVFYNPVMKLNRDLSLLVLATMKNPKIGLPMEASGIRAARIVTELVETKKLQPHSIFINDISPKAIEIAKQNVQSKLAQFSTEDASVFLRKNKPFDYVDIDPFGTPNPFLDAACQAIRKNGILAVTATDTAALTGTYPRATKRKYWATPSRTWVMHEVGLRILIRKVQLVAAQYEKAITPMLSVSTDHYYRIFFRCEKGVNLVKEIIAQHGFVHVDMEKLEITETAEENVGPLWKGELHDQTFVKELLSLELGEAFTEAQELLGTISDECQIQAIGFHDMHELSSAYKFEPVKRDALLEKLGKRACRTHIVPTGFKSNLPVKKLVTFIKDLAKK